MFCHHQMCYTSGLYYHTSIITLLFYNYFRFILSSFNICILNFLSMVYVLLTYPLDPIFSVPNLALIFIVYTVINCTYYDTAQLYSYNAMGSSIGRNNSISYHMQMRELTIEGSQ